MNIENCIFKTIRKVISVFVAFLFIFNQTLMPAIAAYPGEKALDLKQADQPTTTLENPATLAGVLEQVQTSQAFLSEESPLKASDASEKEEVSEAKTLVSENESLDSEKSFEEAVAEISKDYASAVIVKSISAKDLEALTKLDVEVGIAVIENKIVLFTSGSSEEIRVNVAAVELLSNAEFIAHTHVGENREKPSLSDLGAAGSSVEYEVSKAGVYAYNEDGMIREQAYSFQFLSDKLKGAADEKASSVAARQILNSFIQAIDTYNQNREDSEIFRSADAVTVFPNRPLITTFASSSAYGQADASISVNQQSSSVFTMNYNVTNDGSFGGSIINFGTSYANMSDSSITKFTFGMITDNPCQNSDCIKVEFLDSNNRLAAVRVRSLTPVSDPNSTNFTQINIPKSTILLSNSSFDFAHIKQINFVIDHGMAVNKPQGFLKIQTGGLYFQPTIAPDATQPDIETLPLMSNGKKPEITPFASQGTGDASTVSTVQASQTFTTINFNLSKTDSYGGVFISYDDFGTSGTKETVNLETAFPDGIVFQLDNAGTSISQAKFEVTDVNGNRATALLTGIGQYGQRWKIDLSALEGIDLTKITTVSIVAEGQVTGGKLNLDWGPFAYVPNIPADTTNPAITALPLLSNAKTPELTGFASAKRSDGTTVDASTSTVTLASKTFATIDMNLLYADSYGGAFISYDDFGTSGTKETVNLETAFPNGIVFQLDNGGTNLTEVTMEVTDVTGKRDIVVLTGIENFGKKWKILASQFEDIDVTKVTTITLVAKGIHANVKLNLDWGPVAFTPELPADGTNPATTALPVNDLQNRPDAYAFAGTKKPDGSDDNSTASLVLASQSFATLNTNLLYSTSFSGMFVSYDNLLTAGSIETANFETAFPNGIVIGLDNAGTDITEVALEVRDVTGKTDTVILTGIEQYGKRWKILANQFDDVDITQIQTISILITGIHNNAKLNIDWGGFNYNSPDLTNPAITTLPRLADGNKPAVTSFASNLTPQGNPDSSTASVVLASQTFATVTMNLALASSVGGVFVSYDNFTTQAQETMNLNTSFPNGIVLGLDNGGTDVKEALLEVTDASGKRASVLLRDIKDFGQRWNVALHQFVGVDLTKITTISLVVLGVHANAKLNIDWGVFAHTPEIPADLTNPAVTALPVNSLSKKPELTGFASLDNSASSVRLYSTTFGTVSLNTATDQSFGGVFVNYDDENTTDTVEIIDLNALFPSGIVLQMDNGNTNLNEVVFEVTDITGKRDTVILTGIENFGKKWKVLASQFDDVDVTKIQTVSLYVVGKYTDVKLNLDWGNFDYTAQADGTAYNAAAITPLPGSPVVVSRGGKVAPDLYEGLTALTQNSSSAFTVNYNLNGSPSSFVFTQIDFPQTAGASLPEELIFAIRGPMSAGAGTTSKIKVEVVDKNGKIAVFILNVTGTMQNYALIMNDNNVPAGFDRTAVDYINFVVDRGLTNFNYVDSFIVESKGLQYSPILAGQAFNTALHSALPGRPAVSAFGGKVNAASYNGVANLTQESGSIFHVDYNLYGSEDSFVFSQIDFGAAGKTLPENLVMGFEGSPSKIKAEIVDKNGVMAVFYLTLSGTAANYTFTLSGDNVPAGFDRTAVRYINFVVDRNLSGGAYLGTFKVWTQALNYEPILTGTAYDAGLHTTLPGSPVVTAFGGKVNADSYNGVAVINQTSPRDFSVAYNLYGSADSFSVAQIQLGAAGKDLYSGFTLGLKGPEGAQLKVEVVDANGKTAIYYVNVTAAFKNYQFTFPADVIPAGFDASKISFINFVIDRAHSNWNYLGSFEVATRGLSYLPILNGETFNESLITQLPGKPAAAAYGGKVNAASYNGLAWAVQTSPDDLRIDYNLYGSEDSFAFGQISFGTAGKALPENFVLALKAPANSQLKVEFQDKNGQTAVFLLNVTDSYQNYTFVLSGDNVPNGFDRQTITAINFVVDRTLSNWHYQDSFYVKTDDLAYVPQYAALPSSDTSAITTLPLKNTGEKPLLTSFASKGTAEDPDSSTASVVMGSQTFATINLDLKLNTSFGGVFADYDNYATSSAVETADFTAAFPNGIVLQVDNANTGIDQVQFEVTDINGKRALAMLTGVGQYGQRWKIALSDLAYQGVDLSKIRTVVLLAVGKHENSKLNVDWGQFAFTPVLPADGTNPELTYLPANGQQNNPDLVGFASAKRPDDSTDASATNVTLYSNTFAALDLNLLYDSSFGGAFLSYDDFLTTGTTETADLASAFPNGIVLGLDNGGSDITQVTLEMTDINGKRDTVILDGIESFGKRWKILSNQFDDVDMTKIQTVSIVVLGQHANAKLNIDWGRFNYTGPDLTNPAVTVVPKNASGMQPALNAFASEGTVQDPDTSSASVVMASQTFAGVTLNLKKAASYGGVFFTYDDFTTTGIESINLNALFPNGIVLGLDNGSTSLSEVTLEVTDAGGNRASVLLKGITAIGQRWNVALHQFTGVDLTKIKTFALVAKGNLGSVKLNIDWGNFFFVPEIPADLSNPAITYLPALSTGKTAQVLTFASLDQSTAEAVLASETFATINLDLKQPGSYGGTFLSYDDFGTTPAVETMNLETAFPNGIVLGLDNGGTALTQAVLEVTDVNGKSDSVILTGIESFGKRWKVLASQFDGVDITKIKTVVLLATGQHANVKLNVDWGVFDYTPTANAEDYNASLITQLPSPATVSATGSKVETASFPGVATLTQSSASEFKVGYNLNGSEDSFVFAQIGFGYDSNSNPVTKSISSPLVFALKNETAGTKVKVEVVDKNNKTAFFILNLTTDMKNYTLNLSGSNLPAGFDLTAVKFINFVVDRGLANWDFESSFDVVTKGLEFDPILNGTTLNADLWTTFPAGAAVSAAGGKVNASSYPGVAALQQLSDGAFKLGYDLNGSEDSFVFAQIGFGYNGDTPIAKSIGTPLIFALVGETAGSKVKVEVVDQNNKVAAFYLNLTENVQNFILNLSGDNIPQGFDLTAVKFINFVMDRTGANWDYASSFTVYAKGGLDYDPSVPSNPAYPAVTLLPKTSAAKDPEVSPFASQTNPDGSADRSTVSVNVTDAKKAKVTFNLQNATSYGGVFINYDNPATTGVKETINLSSVFAGGMVFGLDNGGTALTEVALEVTDINGKKDKVILTNIPASENRWTINTIWFDEVDTTKIQSIAFVVNGQQANTVLNIDWGNFSYTPAV